MAAPHHRLTNVSAGGFVPSNGTEASGQALDCALSEFEYAQISKIAKAGAILAANVVQWHRDAQASATGDLEQHLSHGLGVAALGALVMQILAWTRLLEPPNVPPSTLRVAREVMDGSDPEVDPASLDCRARALLQQAFAIKAQARRVSRLW